MYNYIYIYIYHDWSTLKKINHNSRSSPFTPRLSYKETFPTRHCVKSSATVVRRLQRHLNIIEPPSRVWTNPWKKCHESKTHARKRRRYATRMRRRSRNYNGSFLRICWSPIEEPARSPSNQYVLTIPFPCKIECGQNEYEIVILWSHEDEIGWILYHMMMK